MTSHLCITTYTSPGQEQLKLELCFVGQNCPRVPAILGATYGCQARRLDLSFNALESLNGLERFPHLEELILDNNRLTDDVNWPAMPHLTTLSLNKNLFCNVLVLLSKLKDACPQLRYLSLLNNCACPDQLSVDCPEQEYRRYRLVVLHYLPKLCFLDSRRVRGREAKEAREGGGRLSPVLQCPTLLDASDPQKPHIGHTTSHSYTQNNNKDSKKDNIIKTDKDCGRISSSSSDYFNFSKIFNSFNCA